MIFNRVIMFFGFAVGIWIAAITDRIEYVGKLFQTAADCTKKFVARHEPSPSTFVRGVSMVAVYAVVLLIFSAIEILYRIPKLTIGCIVHNFKNLTSDEAWREGIKE